jgi:lipopolysaccharide transport system ATP-binding protein
MSDVAIRVNALSKKYHIGAVQQHKTIRDLVSESLTAPFRRIGRLARGQAGGAADLDEEFWALRDISFEVKHGEVVGIIGRNGAGKSTLLKILSRITGPTEGRVELHGRVGSLLEVGTGFHPELTGRENVSLNGAILGMKRAEIDQKFDEIVAFAEIGKFIDTPVKHYSSGMQVRLAFAVAAHLEPEILIVDEVLAVGDAAFQKKCLGKMEGVAGEGRTVLFVSHNMAAVEHLCHRGIVLQQGEAVFDGSQSEAIARYLTSVQENMGALRDRTDRHGSGVLRFVDLEFRDVRGERLDVVCAGQDVDVVMRYETEGEVPTGTSLAVSLMVKTQMDVPVFLQHNRLTGDTWQSIPVSGAFVCRLKRLPLPAANYNLTINVAHHTQVLDHLDDAAQMIVAEGDFFQSGEIPLSSHGVCLVDAEWRVEAA